jgi:hypothetical protein
VQNLPEPEGRVKPARIVSDEETERWRNAWLALGGVAGALAMLVAMQAWERVLPPPLAVEAPQIIEQGPMRTVLRVHTRRGDADVVCTITVDHARRSFVVNC